VAQRAQPRGSCAAAAAAKESAACSAAAGEAARRAASHEMPRRAAQRAARQQPRRPRCAYHARRERRRGRSVQLYIRGDARTRAAMQRTAHVDMLLCLPDFECIPAPLRASRTLQHLARLAHALRDDDMLKRRHERRAARGAIAMAYARAAGPVIFHESDAYMRERASTRAYMKMRATRRR